MTPEGWNFTASRENDEEDVSSGKVCATRLFSISLVFLAALAAVLSFGCRRSAPEPQELDQPAGLVDAARQLSAVRPFINPDGRGILSKLQPAWTSQVATEDLVAAMDSSAWRRTDRKMRFDSVILAGPPNEYQALLDHLLESPDWRLARIDNWGFLFIREAAAPYSPAPPDMAGGEIPGDEFRARYLAQMATNLAAAGFSREARACMTAASKLGGENPEILGRQALLDLTQRRWSDAAANADRALAADPKNVAALQIKAQALAGAGRSDLAWQTSERLLDVSGDPFSLFLHARLAHAVHAYGREQDSLEKLVASSVKSGRSATLYRLYLGQCHAKQGRATEAISQFEAVLTDSGLGPKQRAEVEETLATVRKRAGTVR